MMKISFETSIMTMVCFKTSGIKVTQNYFQVSFWKLQVLVVIHVNV